MIGLGTWEGTVSTFLFKATATVEVLDNNGQYDFRVHLPEKYSNVQFRYYDIEENGNTLSGKGEASLFPGKVFEVHVTFDGDKMSGEIVLPFMANQKIEIKNGHKIA